MWALHAGFFQSLRKIKHSVAYSTSLTWVVVTAALQRVAETFHFSLRLTASDMVKKELQEI